MQKNYSYVLAEAPGRNFAPGFTPAFSPRQMLEMGVFEGHYCTDCLREFPRAWFATAIKMGKIRSDGADPQVNYFGVKSRLSLPEWQSRGWIIGPDPRGWFQWFMRYWLGRRIPDIDAIQIGRWRAFARHYAQVKLHAAKQLDKRQKQRQALLQWSWDCFV